MQQFKLKMVQQDKILKDAPKSIELKTRVKVAFHEGNDLRKVSAPYN